MSARKAALSRVAPSSGAWTEIGSFGGGAAAVGSLGIDATDDLGHATGLAAAGAASLDVRRDADQDTGSTSPAVTVSDPPAPVGADDTAHGASGHPVELDVIANDAPGADSAPLEPSSVAFIDPAATNDRRELSVAGEGAYRIDPSTGVVTFTPVPGFQGPATPVEYRVSDSNATPAHALIRVTIGLPPSAVDDSARGAFGHPVIVGVLGNDTAGDDGDGALGELVAASVVLDAGAVTAAGRKLATEDGTWTVAPSTGAISFAPADGFTGAASVDYSVTDGFGNTASATLAVTVGSLPVAGDDAATTLRNQPVSIDVLANDLVGDPSAPLDPASVRFTSAAAGEDGTRLAVAGEGVWTIAADGLVTFTPESGFSGTAGTVGYRVLDRNGAAATASIVVVIGADPVAAPDQEQVWVYGSVVIPVLDNDSAGAGCTLDPDSVGLLGLGAAEAVAPGTGELIVPSEGIWSVISGGALAFTPTPDFGGWTSWVTYSVHDSCGNGAQARARVYMPAATTTVDPAEDPGEGTGGGGQLAHTGTEVGGLLVMAIACVLGGGLLVALTGRPRREEDSPAAECGVPPAM